MTNVVDRSIKLNTTKIKDINIKDKFYETFDIYLYQVHENDTVQFYKNLETNVDYISTYKAEGFNINNIYILTKKGMTLPSSYTLPKKGDVPDYIIINLLLKAIPELISDSNCMSTDNLIYLYNTKKCKQVDEYIFFEFLLTSNNVLKVNSVTYSNYEQLKSLFENENKKKNYKLQQLNSKTRYYLSKKNKNFVKYRKYNDKENNLNSENKPFSIVKYKGNNKKNITKALTYNKDALDKSKMKAFYVLFQELDKIKDLIEFQLDSVIGEFYLTNDKVLIMSNKLLKETELRELFKNKKVGIINLTEDENISNYVINSVTKNGTTKSSETSRNKTISKDIVDPIFSIVKDKKDNLDHYLILMHNKEHYEKNDPYLDYKNLDTQIVTIENKKENNYKDIIRTSLIRLLIKENLREKKLISFKSQNHTLIKIETKISKKLGQENYIIHMNAINIHDNQITLLNENEMDYFITKYNKLFSKIKYSGERQSFYILSYGNKKEFYEYDNICFISKNDEIVLPDFKSIVENVGDKSILNRQMKDYGIHHKMAGVIGCFYVKENNKVINYYIGEMASNLNDSIKSFCSYYNVEFITGKYDDSFFKFFFIDHSYVRANGVPTVPFSNVYINEAIDNNILQSFPESNLG